MARIAFHRQRSGESWRSMMARFGRFRVGASVRADYGIIMVQYGSWHRSLEVGWRDHVHGLRVLP